MVEGRPKMLEPMMEFSTSAARLQRPMARTSWVGGGEVTGGRDYHGSPGRRGLRSRFLAALGMTTPNQTQDPSPRPVGAQDDKLALLVSCGGRHGWSDAAADG